jgi:hypothetical protein
MDHYRQEGLLKQLRLVEPLRFEPCVKPVSKEAVKAYLRVKPVLLGQPISTVLRRRCIDKGAEP